MDRAIIFSTTRSYLHAYRDKRYPLLSQKEEKERKGERIINKFTASVLRQG